MKPCLPSVLSLVLLASGSAEAQSACPAADPSVPAPFGNSTRLSRSADRFTINGSPTFLLGVSYFSCLYATDSQIVQDLDDMQSRGFNVARCWVNWPIHWSNWQTESADNCVLVKKDGTLNQTALGKLKKILALADARGIVVDATFNQDTPKKTVESHMAGVEAAAQALTDYNNVIFDLQNETDHYYDGNPIQCPVAGSSQTRPCFLTESEAGTLRGRVLNADSGRLVVASFGDEYLVDDKISWGPNKNRAEAQAYVRTPGAVIAAALHCCRNGSSLPAWDDATGTAADNLRSVLGCTSPKKPIYFQEPNRCACTGGGICKGGGQYVSNCETTNTTEQSAIAAEFTNAAQSARDAGAAGWIFHTMGGYDLRWNSQKPRFRSRLNGTEKKVFDQLAPDLGPWATGCP